MILEIALVAFICGAIIFLIGIGLGKLFNSSYEAHRIGLDRPLNLSVEEQFTLFFRYPNITIPLLFTFFGVFILLASIVAVIVGGIQAIIQTF